MSPVYGNAPDAGDDFICPGCGAPLLTRKSTCPRCGTRAAEPAPPPPPPRSAPGAYRPPDLDDNEPPLRGPVAFRESSRAPKSAAAGGDDILTYALLFFAGLGLIFALFNPMIFGLDPVSLWRSFMIGAASLALMALRRLIIR